MKTALYRHWDKDGALLYVGISLSAVARLAQHRTSSPWFHDIANVTIEWFDGRDGALEAERAAIKAESPRHNIAHRAANDNFSIEAIERTVETYGPKMRSVITQLIWLHIDDLGESLSVEEADDMLWKAREMQTFIRKGIFDGEEDINIIMEVDGYFYVDGNGKIRPDHDRLAEFWFTPAARTTAVFNPCSFPIAPTTASAA